jgi:putative membrane protein
MVAALKTFFRIYAEGLRGMTWGRTLWIIVLVKLFVMFAVLKLFFFQPTLKGSADQKATTVGDNFVQEQPK